MELGQLSQLNCEVTGALAYWLFVKGHQLPSFDLRALHTEVREVWCVTRAGKGEERRVR